MVVATELVATVRVAGAVDVVTAVPWPVGVDEPRSNA